MAEVIVLHNQADYVEQAKENLPARAIGWAKGERVLVFQEDLGDGEKGQAFEVPSTVGAGMGRRVTKTAHGFAQNTVLRLNDAGTYVRALAVDGQWGTHLVVAVLDANTFDVATSGAWIAGLGNGPIYLSETVAGQATATPSAQLIGHGDNVSIHLAFGGTAATEAFPKGPAGGDLGGEYASPIVKQITGIGADLVQIDCDFQFPTSSYGAPNGGRGVGYGRIFVGGIEVKAWGAQSEAGDLYWTVDHWKTSTHDVSLKSTAGQRWNCFRFAYLAALSSYAWIAGDGYHKTFYYALHTAANYNTDGTLKASAWAEQSYTTGPGNVGDMSVHGSVICFVGNDYTLGYTNDFASFSVKFTASAVLGGVDTDQYGTWLAVERDTGVLWRSINDGATWAQVSSLTVDGAVVSHLPTGVQWGAINSAYGLWVASVWSTSPTPGSTSYAYSEDGVNWFSFADPTPTSFYTCAFDGVRWYATNANALQDPPIYQMLVDSVPVKRRLALEKGAAISGPVFLTDMPDAAVLGTDQNGKVVSKTIPDLLGDLDYVAFDTTPETSITQVGAVSWNADEGTLDIQQPYGVTLQAGQELQIHIINKSGVAIPNGAPVYISGAQGNRPSVALAEADVVAHAQAIAIATMDIANNAEGYVTRVGLVRQLNTSSFTEGAALYLSDAPGVLTATPPTSRTVRVAYVVRSHATVGAIFVAIDSTPNLDDLGDVDATSPTEGYYLKFVSGRWVPAAVSGGGGSAALKYASTMKAASQSGNITLNTGGSTQWAAHGTIMVAEGDVTLTQNASKFAVICPQPVSGASFILAIYAWPDAGTTMTLVAQTSVNVMPGSSSWLEALMTSAGATLLGGKRYFFVVLWNGNGATLAGTTGANLNVQPYLSFRKNNMGVLTAAPATLTAEGELPQHFFGRVVTP